jgi:Glycosyl hydrolases family 16
MINSRLGFLALTLLAVKFPPHAALAEPSSSCELRPVFIEDFNEETAPNRRTESISAYRIGPARWTAHTPWSGDFGDAFFINPLPERPFKIKNGILSIIASKDQQGKWTSGLLAAADARGVGSGTRYGYFEVRMKMPPGPGTWPAFWLAPLKPVGTADGNVEIDVIEYYGHDASAYQAVWHVWYKDATKNRGQNLKVDVPDNSLVDDFHIFGVDISPQAIVFFRDGKSVWTQPTPPELDGPLYPLVNLALGSGYPIDKTPNPSILLVDYVHVYERSTGPPEGCPPGLPPTPR